VSIGRIGVAGLFRSLTRKDWHLVDQWLERLGLTPLARQGYGEISGGEQRKTLIARAMAQQPELLLLDEPTANLDLGWRERIVRTIQDLSVEAGLTTLLVCHEVEILPACCRRVIILRNGGLIADGSPDTVLTDDLIVKLFGQGLRVLHTAGRHAVVPGGVPHA
jgi:iron complex transport system ATP-binding protein